MTNDEQVPVGNHLDSRIIETFFSQLLANLIRCERGVERGAEVVAQHIRLARGVACNELVDFVVA